MTLAARIGMSVLGVAVCGVSVGMFRTAALGVDPFQALMSGLASLVPMGFGTLYLTANAGLLLFAAVFDRRKIGPSTVINLTLLGYIAQYSQALFTALVPHGTLPSRLLLLAAAVAVMCLSSALYFNADLGVSPYDAVALVLAQGQKRFSFKACRVMTDLVCVALGAALCRLSGMGWRETGGVVGVGTVVTAFFMGPLISFFSGLLPGGRQ